MSFEFTPEEQRRVRLASILGIELDPIDHKDLALIIVISVIYFADLIAISFLLWNRNYPPIKSKHPVLMFMCMLSLMFWFVGDLVLNQHVHVQGTMSHCILFCVWMRTILGTLLASSLIALRSFALFCIFRRNHAFNGKYVYGAVGGVAVVMLTMIIVTYALPKTNTVFYVPGMEMCDLSHTYRAIMQSMLWSIWSVTAILNYRLRNITSSFNESREMAVACISVLILIGYNTIILYVYPLYPTRSPLRLSETYINHLLSNFLWWFIMFTPMYNCAFRRDGYLIMWKQKLIKDGLQKQYQMARGDPFSETIISSGSNPAKIITISRSMANAIFSYDGRMSFSHPNTFNQSSVGICGVACSESMTSGESSAGDDQSNAILFSPCRQEEDNSPHLGHLEHMSSSTTVHDGGVNLARYHFPTPQ